VLLWVLQAAIAITGYAEAERISVLVRSIREYNQAGTRSAGQKRGRKAGPA